uniref:Putative esf1 n=1 Tax=Anopheles triannulatus TaxID=58253 RepID=A0A2M4AHI2_9DIPT
MKESGKKSKRASTGGGGAMVRLKPETPATATAVSQGSGKASKIWEDSRFAHLVNDPRFRGLPKSEKKVKIDSRFKSMFQDERFQVKATVDKYGRPLRRADTDELKKFYELDEDEEEDEEELQREREREERAMEGRGKEVDEEQEKSDGESDSSDDDDDDDGLQLTEEEKRMVLSEKIKNRLKDLDVDYARGEAQLYSEDEEDDEDDEEDDEEEDEVFIEHVWGELDADVERTEDSTNRLAVCHMDWDRIRAVDIMVLLSSFLPPGCSIKSVKIYPSEFGKERMQEEEERGPQELTVRTVDGSDEEEEDEEQQKERLREYQLNRLKYYYAVVECDSVETADKIYKECDGVEYESTANKLDLRFIPDEMDFGDDEPKDSCSELPEMGKYVPRIFTTTALNQAKVELTWDENDVERKEFNEKLRDGKWAQMPETELKKYVACSSSSEGEEEEETNGRRKSKKKRSILLIRAPKSDESEEDDDDDDDDDDSDEEAEPRESNKKQDMIAKYKALLSDMKEQEKAEEEEQVGMEFTWKVDDKEESNEADGNESSDRTGSSKLPNDVNPFEKILQKKKEKNKKRKELKKRRKRGELDDDAENGNGSADSESEDDLPYGVDLNDPFFASAFDEKEFGKPQKKQSKSKERDTKSKEEEEREAAEEARRKAELELLLDDGDDNRSHFNLRAIQEREIDLKSVSKSKRRRLLKKSKRQIEEQRNGRADAATAEDDFEIDVEDSRFGAIFSKPEYNIDPTNPAFKKTKGIERIIEHKLKKRRLAENDVREEEVEESGRGVRETKKQKKDVATTMLVKSIKRKIGKSN